MGVKESPTFAFLQLIYCTGVLQGCLPSPLLFFVPFFKACKDVVIKEFDNETLTNNEQYVIDELNSVLNELLLDDQSLSYLGS